MKSLLLSLFFLVGCGESLLPTSEISNGLGPLAGGTNLFIPGSNASLGGDGNFYDGTCSYGQACFFGGFVPEGTYLMGARVDTDRLCKRTPELRAPFVPGNLEVKWDSGVVSYKVNNQCDKKMKTFPRQLSGDQVEGFTFFHPDLGIEAPIIVSWTDQDRPEVATKKYLFNNLGNSSSSSPDDVVLEKEYFTICHIADSPFSDINQDFKTSFVMKSSMNTTGLGTGIMSMQGYLVVGERESYLDADQIDFLYTDAFPMTITQEDYNLGEGFMKWKYEPANKPISVSVEIHTREVLPTDEVMVTLKIQDGDVIWSKRTACVFPDFNGSFRNNSGLPGITSGGIGN